MGKANIYEDDDDDDDRDIAHGPPLDVRQALTIKKASLELLYTASGAVPLQVIKAAVPFSSSIILSRIHPDIRSAMLLIQTVIDFTLNVLNSPLNVMNTMVGKLNNVNNRDKIGQTVHAGWLFALLLSLPQIVLLCYAKPILDALDQDQEITGLVRAFFNRQVISTIFMTFLVACNQVALGAEKPHLPVLSQIFGLIGYASLIYPLTHRTGASLHQILDGAGLTYIVNAVIGAAVSLLIFAVLSKENNSFQHFGIFKFKYKFIKIFENIKTIALYGWQIFLITASELGILTINNFMVSSSKQSNMTAQLIINQYQDICLIATAAFGAAAQTRIANNIEKSPQDIRKYLNMSVIFSMIIPILYMFLSLLAPTALINVFIGNTTASYNETSSPAKVADEILNHNRLFLISGFNCLFMSVRYVTTFGLFGAGKFDKSLVLNMMSSWLGLGVGVLAVKRYGCDSIIGMNMGLSLGFFISAVGQSLNWHLKSSKIIANSHPQIARELHSPVETGNEMERLMGEGTPNNQPG